MGGASPPFFMTYQEAVISVAQFLELFYTIDFKAVVLVCVFIYGYEGGARD